MPEVGRRALGRRGERGTWSVPMFPSTNGRNEPPGKPLPETQPNLGVQATANSVRSCLAPALRRASITTGWRCVLAC
jgi:hypothetical protein